MTSIWFANISIYSNTFISKKVSGFDEKEHILSVKEGCNFFYISQKTVKSWNAETTVF